MNFNKTTVATFVGAALASVALSAAAGPNINSSQSYKSIENVLASKMVAQSNAITVSGMKNQYDAQLNAVTFKWAGKAQLTPDLGAISAEHQLTFAADFYLSQLTGLSTSKNNGSVAVLTNTHDLGRGAKIAKYKQEIAGIEIFNREYNVMMDTKFNLVASSGYFADQKAVSAAPRIKDIDVTFGKASSAINAAYTDVSGKSNAIELVAKKSADKYERFAVANVSGKQSLVGEPRAKKVFFEHKGKLVPAHYVEVETSEVDSVESKYFSYVVSAKDNSVLFKNDLTSHADDYNYRVYADADGRPWDGPHGNVIPAPTGADPMAFLTADYLTAPMVSLSHGPISTGDAWLAEDATETVGNNVSAYVDAIAPQGFSDGDFTAELTSANTFDYSYSDAEAEYSFDNRKAAIVNLFYMNNYLHDDYYDHGFDEASGNAQVSNYGRGGEEGDALNVEVQDHSGQDNANMSTPADGASPRMQMYLWDATAATPGVDFGVTVTSHAEVGALLDIQFASFGPQVYELSGNIVRLDDGFAETEEDGTENTTKDGCEPAINGADLMGNIAIIDRGACAFTEKVLHAQAEGAIAVLIANNNAGNTPAPMGGSDDAVTIPSMGLSYEDGVIIDELLAADGTVSISMFSNDLSRRFKDSSWDNAIVAHEWGHYISNRLVGNASGLITNQARSMGEGWGDFHALMAITEADDDSILGNEGYAGAYADVTYVRNFVTGIRRVPYSTNMDINPLTFAYIELSAEVHDSGEIWATALWEAFIGLVNSDSHTFDEAKSLMKDYVVAGYKMTPIAPTFTEARDAILAAAYANDVEDYNTMLTAFAKRGMGLGAVSPDRWSGDHAGVVESYVTEAATFNVTEHTLDTNYAGPTSGYCSNDNVLDKGETGTVSFTIQNAGSENLVQLQGKVEVVSGHDVTFANDGMIDFADIAQLGSTTSSPIEFTLNDAETADELVLKLTFPDLEEGVMTQDYELSTNVNMNFEMREVSGTTQYSNVDTLATMNDFTEHQMGPIPQFTEGTWGQELWGYNDTDHYIHAQARPFDSDIAFETKPMTVGFEGDFYVQWYNMYYIEQDWDGGVVEIKVNGGEWKDITEAGGEFLGAGYSGDILSFTGTSIAGEPAFTGDYDGGWELAYFGTALNGNQVQFRFRMVTDGGVGAYGWIIDDLYFENAVSSVFSDIVEVDTTACDNRLPTVTIGADQEVNEGASVTLAVDAIDPNGDALTYTWTQTSGDAVTLTGGDTASATFTAPEQSSGSAELAFSVTVNDGTDAVVAMTKVTVNDVPAPVVVAPRVSRGGGSTGLLALLLLPLALLRRRK